MTAPLIKSFIPTSAAILVLIVSSTVMARGGYHHAQAEASAPPCGVAAGGLPDPAETQRCLAERYKAPKPKPQKTDAAPAANATGRPP